MKDFDWTALIVVAGAVCLCVFGGAFGPGLAALLIVVGFLSGTFT